MAERKIKVMFNGKLVDAMDVSVEESNERWSEFKLEDGSILRAKMTVISVARIDGEYDALGNPAYVMNMTPTIAVIEIPERLRKKVQ